jgi:hypothetical protein
VTQRDIFICPGLASYVKRKKNLIIYNFLEGWTALMWAINGYQIEAVQILLNHGAEKSLETRYGRTVFQYPTALAVKELLGSPPSTNKPVIDDKEKKITANSSKCDTDNVDKSTVEKSVIQSSFRTCNGSNILSEIDYYAVDGYSHFLNNHTSGGVSAAVADPPRRKPIPNGSTTTKALSPPDFSQLTKAIASPRQELKNKENMSTYIAPIEDEEDVKRWEASIKSSNTFSWNKCLPDQMFVFSQDDMHLILDQALNVTDIKSLMNKSQLSNELWQPANIIFLSARFVHYCSSRELLNLLFNTVAAKLTRIIKVIVNAGYLRASFYCLSSCLHSKFNFL